MEQLRGMSIEMPERSYNLYQRENHGVNLDDHPEYRTYQTLYDMRTTSLSHEEITIHTLGKAQEE